MAEDGGSEEGSGIDWGSDRAEALSFEFKGAAREYFRIWIVNLCLTLVTLGLFSAWAKVRKKRYFYSNTVLDGSPFQYLGKPIPILKGRIVATALAVVWYTITNFVPELWWLLLIAALVLTPWIAVRSAAFNARYSAYRNLTWHFSGNYWTFAKTVYGWLLYAGVTCGLGFPWFRAHLTRYMVSHTSFGGVRARFRRTGGQFLGPYLISGLTTGLLVAVVGWVFTATRVAHGMPSMRSLQRLGFASYVAYFFVFVYLKARITNLVWGGIALGSVRFTSTLSMRGLLFIYFTNTLAIVASLGLLIPWAVIRTLRYRAEHFAVQADLPLDEFDGGDRTTVRAAGAELGEFFDLDVAL